MPTPINLGDDYEAEMAIARKKTENGAWEGATGLSSLKFQISATRKGGAIHASLSLPASARSEQPDPEWTSYFVIFPVADVSTHLASYEGKDVYRQLWNGTKLLSSVAVRVLATANV